MGEQASKMAAGVSKKIPRKKSSKKKEPSLSDIETSAMSATGIRSHHKDASDLPKPPPSIKEIIKQYLEDTHPDIKYAESLYRALLHWADENFIAEFILFPTRMSTAKKVYETGDTEAATGELREIYRDFVEDTGRYALNIIGSADKMALSIFDEDDITQITGEQTNPSSTVWQRIERGVWLKLERDVRNAFWKSEQGKEWLATHHRHKETAAASGSAHEGYDNELWSLINDNYDNYDNYNIYNEMYGGYVQGYDSQIMGVYDEGNSNYGNYAQPIFILLVGMMFCLCIVLTAIVSMILCASGYICVAIIGYFDNKKKITRHQHGNIIDHCASDSI